jgi:hypothetical protein
LARSARSLARFFFRAKFGPFSAPNDMRYLILQCDTVRYEHCVVGLANRSHMWMLARTSMPGTTPAHAHAHPRMHAHSRTEGEKDTERAREERERRETVTQPHTHTPTPTHPHTHTHMRAHTHHPHTHARTRTHRLWQL